MRRSGGFGEWTRFVLAAVAIAAGAVIASGQITVPNTFVNGTVADAPQVNANFNAVAANALNRTGGTMTGTLGARDITPSADATYSLGTHALRFLNLSTTGTAEFNTHVYTWPSVQGTLGQLLSNNGSDTLSWASATPIPFGDCNLALTLTTATPETIADVTAATSVFVTPVAGGQCGFYDGSATWTLLTNAEVTVAVPATTSTIYDVWCRNNAGTIACDTTAWTNDTTRATALGAQNNVPIKTGDTTRRYIGSFRTTTVSGQTEDSAAKRYVFSYYYRPPRQLAVTDTTDTWSYTTTTFRQANGSTANQVSVLAGVPEVLVDLNLMHLSSGATGNVFAAIGEDSTTTAVTGQLFNFRQGDGNFMTLLAKLSKHPAVGLHSYMWLEKGNTTATFYGDGGGLTQTGLSGWKR